jgi:hypothetical protein
MSITVTASNRVTSELQTQNANILPPISPPRSYPSIRIQQHARRLAGELPNGKRLARPIAVWIVEEEEGIIVTEPQYHIHASGDCVEEAFENFRWVLVDSLSLLEEDESSLGPHLRGQLDYLRSIVIPA